MGTSWAARLWAHLPLQRMSDFLRGLSRLPVAKDGAVDEEEGTALADSAGAFNVWAADREASMVWLKPMDIVEGYAGEGATSKLAQEFGLQAGPLVDIRYGWDLDSEAGKKAWVDLIKQAEPLLVMAGFPCTSFCAFNVRLNHRGREHVLAARQAAMKPMLELMVQTFEWQASKGRYFLLEIPSVVIRGYSRSSRSGTLFPESART